MSAVEVFDGNSTAPDPPGSSSLIALDGPVDPNRKRLQEARAAGISPVTSNHPESGQNLYVVGDEGLRATAQETETATTNQPAVHDGPGQAQSQEGIHAARSNVVEHERARQPVADGDTHAASVDWPPAPTSEERGGDESADNNGLSDATGGSVSAQDVHTHLARGAIMVAAPPRSDASGETSPQQHKRRTAEDGAPMDELVAGRRVSCISQDNATPYEGTPAQNQVDDQGSFPGEQGGHVQGTPAHHRAGEELPTYLEYGTRKIPSVFDVNLDPHQENQAAEGLLEFHHGYRQIMRPRTRSGSRAGTMGYGATGVDQDRTKDDQAPEGEEGGKTPRNDTKEMEKTAPENLDEWNRSKLEAAGRTTDSSPVASVGSKLDDHKHCQGAANANHPQSVRVSQSDASSGSVRTPLEEEHATGASPTTEAKHREDTGVHPSFKELRTLNGDISTSTSAAFTAANDKEKAPIGISSLDGGDLTAVDYTAERAGGGDPRTAVPNYLSSSERGRRESEKPRSGFASDMVDSTSALNGAPIETQRVRGPPPTRRIAGRNDVLGSIAVAGKRMSIDSEKGEGYQQGATAVGSNAAGGRKSVTTTGREGHEILRRSSSSGVWRYDDLDQHRQQETRGMLPMTSLSMNAMPQGDVGKVDLPAVDGRVAPGLLIGEPRRKSQQQHRLDCTRQMVRISSAEAYGGIAATSDNTGENDIPGDNTGPVTAIGGGDLVAREDRWLFNVSPGTSHAEEALFGVVGHGAALAIPFGNANAAHARQGGSIIPQPSPVVQAKAAASVANGWPSPIDDVNVGVTHKNTATVEGVAKTGTEGMQAQPRRDVEYDSGGKDLAGASRSNDDQYEHAIVSNRRDNTEVTAYGPEVAAVVHAAEQERMVMAVAKRISDATDTQFDEAIAEVRDALTKNGIEEQREARRLEEEVRVRTDNLAQSFMETSSSCRVLCIYHHMRAN